MNEYTQFGQFSYYGLQTPSAVNPQVVVLFSNMSISADFTTYSFISSLDFYSYNLLWDPEYLIGCFNDDQFESMTTATIVGVLNKEAYAGHIYIYGCRDIFDIGHFSLYVSEDNENWDYLCERDVENLDPEWIDCGVCMSTFSYMQIIGEGGIMYFDSVRVYPLTTYSLTLYSGEDGYIDPEPDTYYLPETTNITVTGYPDSGYVTCWFLDYIPYAANDSVTIMMDGNHTLEAWFVNESWSIQLGNTEVLGSWGTWKDIGDYVCGQAFTCPTYGITQTVTAALYLPFTDSNYTVNAAIYLRSNFTLLAQSEPANISRQGEPDVQWFTFNLTSGVFLEADQDYILVVWAPSDYAYGIYVASDTDWEIQDGYRVYCQWHGESDGVFPDPLYECSDHSTYSIYCTVITG